MAVSVDRPPLSAGESGLTDTYDGATKWITDGDGGVAVQDQSGSPLAEYPRGTWLRIYQAT